MKNAWKDYYRLCKAGGSMPFTELTELAKLKSPFREGTLKDVSEYIYKWLTNIDPKMILINYNYMKKNYLSKYDFYNKYITNI